MLNKIFSNHGKKPPFPTFALIRHPRCLYLNSRVDLYQEELCGIVHSHPSRSIKFIFWKNVNFYPLDLRLNIIIFQIFGTCEQDDGD